MEAKDLLKAFGLPEDIDTVEKAVKAHGDNFITISEAHENEKVMEKIAGEIYGPLNTAAKRLFGLSNEDIKGKKFQDILTLGVGKYTDEINTLKSQNSDEKVKTISDELTKAKTLAEQYKSDLDKVVNEKTELETGFNNKIKEYKINERVKEAKGKLVFAESIPELDKVGFDTQIKEKYRFEMDDKDNLIVLTAAGKKVANPTKSGTYLNLEEVLDMELDQAGLKKKNNAGGFPVRRQEERKESDGGRPIPKVHPAALKAAEKAQNYKNNHV